MCLYWLFQRKALDISTLPLEEKLKPNAHKERQGRRVFGQKISDRGRCECFKFFMLKHLSYIIQKVKYPYVAKMDDYYFSNHLIDLWITAKYSGTALIEKFYTYLFRVK